MSFIDAPGRKYCSSERQTTRCFTSSFSKTSAPSYRTLPESGLMMPAMTRRRVDLPEPFEPISPKIEPVLIVIVTSVSDFIGVRVPR